MYALAFEAMTCTAMGWQAGSRSNSCAVGGKDAVKNFKCGGNCSHLLPLLFPLADPAGLTGPATARWSSLMRYLGT